MGKKKRYPVGVGIVAIAVYAAERGLDVSGIENTALAYSLWVVSGILFVSAAGYFLWAWLSSDTSKEVGLWGAETPVQLPQPPLLNIDLQNRADFSRRRGRATRALDAEVEPGDIFHGLCYVDIIPVKRTILELAKVKIGDEFYRTRNFWNGLDAWEDMEERWREISIGGVKRFEIPFDMPDPPPPGKHPVQVRLWAEGQWWCSETRLIDFPEMLPVKD